jgi:hypothetical protein
VISERQTPTQWVAAVMRAVRLYAPGDPSRLIYEQLPTPRPAAGEALVRVRAAAVTRGELDWADDRLPAIPSYELSGVVAAVAPDASGIAVGQPVYALSGFDRDGAAADYTAVPIRLLAPKPRTLGHVESAAIPLAGLSAWQGLFDHGHLVEGQRVLVHGAAGGVGGFAVQLAHWRGAHVIGTASAQNLETARRLGADQVAERLDLLGPAQPYPLLGMGTARSGELARIERHKHRIQARDGRLAAALVGGGDGPLADGFGVAGRHARPWRVKALRSDGQVVPSWWAAALTPPSRSANA